MVSSKFLQFGGQKVNKITRLLDDFGVAHLNLAYMTNFARSSNFTFEMAEPVRLAISTVRIAVRIAVRIPQLGSRLRIPKEI